MPADDMVVVARIGSPYGVKGWVNLQSFTTPSENVLDYRPWSLQAANGSWRTLEVVQCRAHKKGFVAQFKLVDDRDAAAALSGQMIGVPRAVLPDAETDEYYWRDLIGVQVVTTDGTPLGVVDHLLETGANDVLVVKPTAPDQTELLIPFAAPYVQEVDVAAAQVVVNWQTDW